MREFIDALDLQFARLYAGWRELTERLKWENPYAASTEVVPSATCADELVRSARIIEQTFGGITANLWDDPWEWSLPETLATREKLTEYFDEVEATRQRGFDLLKTDADLLKQVMAPGGEIRLLYLLLDTLIRSGHHHFRAREILRDSHRQ